MLVTRMEEWVRQQRREAEQLGAQLGEKLGEKRGEKRGRQLGEAALLLRQLERRFGVLPDWARDRVTAADTATIEEWGLRLLDAGSLEEVLG